MMYPAYRTNHTPTRALCMRAVACVCALYAATLWADQPPAATRAPASPEQERPVASEEVDREAPDFVTASLLIMGPGDELYSCAGHAALRMECPTYGLDFCFSYESESVKDKVLTFFKGKLKMGMFAVPTEEFLKLYRESGRSVTQYKLDLPPKAETRLWQLLDEKVAEGPNLPYDFFERGCAQAVLSILREAVMPDRLEPGPWPKTYTRTRREFVDSALGGAFPWNRFVLYTVVGSEADRKVSNLEKVVIPKDLLAFLREARIAGRPVVTAEGGDLLPAKSPEPPPFVTPMRISFLVAALAVLGCFVRLPWLVLVFLPFQTLAGLFLAYLVFFSNLPATSWNWLIVPFNPLPAVFWRWRRKWALGFTLLLLVWVAAMALAPHRMTDPAYFVLVSAYAVFYLSLLKQPRIHEKD